jgi:hypothetical protein
MSRLRNVERSVKPRADAIAETWKEACHESRVGCGDAMERDEERERVMCIER